MSIPSVSIVIPSYRQPRTVIATLASVLGQTFRNFELIVVDSSSDETLALIRDFIKINSPAFEHPPILIELSEKSSAGIQRSKGIENARADLIFTTDTDCILPADCLSLVMKQCEESRTQYGQSFAISGAIQNGTPHSGWGSAGYWAEFGAFGPGLKSRVGGFIPSTCLAFSRSRALELGGFIDRPISDDLATLIHWQSAGIQTLFNPRSHVLHVNRTAPLEVLRHQFRLGKDSAGVRAALRTQGSWLVLFPPVWPLLPFFRLFRVSARAHAGCKGWREILRYWSQAPSTLVVLILWSIGFGFGGLQAIWQKALKLWEPASHGA